MKTFKIGILILAFFASAVAQAAVGSGHVSGNITNITSVTSGILVRIGSNEVSENCTSGHVWMKIDQNYTAMISMTITAWTLGKGVTVYTAPTADTYCKITQVDPHG